MFESRCGVLCGSCERKEQVGCKGCTEMKAPFWGGVCEVKKCCEEKQLNYCGECKGFPCEMLSEMGRDAGFDPTIKVEQCRRWKEEAEKSVS